LSNFDTEVLHQGLQRVEFGWPPPCKSSRLLLAPRLEGTLVVLKGVAAGDSAAALAIQLALGYQLLDRGFVSSPLFVVFDGMKTDRAMWLLVPRATLLGVHANLAVQALRRFGLFQLINERMLLHPLRF